MIRRAIVLVLDSLGVGELPDAAAYGDEGSNTLGNMAAALGGLELPNLGRMGLGNIIEVPGTPPRAHPGGLFGKMRERSAGKDTTTGHWELMGLILERPFPTYPQGFPRTVIGAFESKIGRMTLGNYAASGTVIIEDLGEEHLRTGYPIVYTSADSVFQIAAHEEVIPLEELYAMCRTARGILQGEQGVGRVIARPFTGKPGSFARTPHRHDFSLPPTGATLLDLLLESGIPVHGVGKIGDIFAGQGISENHPTESNAEGMETVVRLLAKVDRGLVFANLVDFDMLYGHRNDIVGYASALRAVDDWLPLLLAGVKDDDLLVITADHGCDPTTTSTDHSREHVPVLVTGGGPDWPVGAEESDLGVRDSFSDLGATLAEVFGVHSQATMAVAGTSFADRLPAGVRSQEDAPR